MIKLVKHSLTHAGRFEVESCPLTLSEKDSQIVMTLGPDAPTLEIGDWLLDDEEPGAGIVYRVKTIETDYQTDTRRVTAEHIIQTLRDAVIFGTVDAETMGGSDGLISAAGAIGYALSQCADWQPGTIGYNTSQPYEFNGDSVLEAIETVCTTLVDPWWSYDLSSYPFTLNINPKSSAAQCEMRAERNIATLRRTVDMSRMYTRIYPVGKDDLHITGNYLSQNENIYGVIAKVETDQSKETAGMLQAWAAARLARHCNPSVTIQITGADLSASTGEPLDHLQIGVGCRVPLPEFNTTILETISKLQWKDKKADPESVTVTLANDWEDVASIMRREIASGSGTTGKAGRTRSKQQKEDHAWFVDTDDHVAMVAEAIAGTDGQGKPNWSRVSTLTVDGNGIDSRVTTTESGLVTAQSAIVQAEHGISMSVGTLKGLTLETFPKKKNFPAAGAANRIYLDQETGIYWVYVGGEYKRAKFATDGEGHPITDSSGKIAEVHFQKAGEIALAINESGEAEAHIDAVRVILGQSTLSAEDLATWAKNPYGTGVSATFAKFVVSKEMTIGTLSVTKGAEVDGIKVNTIAQLGSATGKQVIYNANTGITQIQGELDINSTGKITIIGIGGNERYDLNYTTLQSMIRSVSVADNVLTITPFSGSAVNFSKATTLSGKWSGGSYVVTAKQTNKNTTTGLNEETTVATHTYDPLLELDGAGSTNDFSASIYEEQASSGTTHHVSKKSVPGYLAIDGSGTSATVKAYKTRTVEGNTTTYSDPVAYVSVGSLYMAGRNNVTIEKGTWSGGQISFTKSAGTASTKSVQLCAGTPTWGTGADVNKATVEIWDGTAADEQHGSDTGYAVTVNAQTRYDTGKSDATVTMDNFELDTLPGTTTYADVATRVITAHAHNTDNSAKTGSKDTTLAMTASGLVITLTQDNTPIAQITATAPTPSYDTPTITYDTLSGLIDATPGFTVTANGKSNTGYLTIARSTYDVNGTTRHCINAYKEDTQTVVGRLDIQDYAVALYMAGVEAGGDAATLESVSTSGRTKAGDLTAGDTVGIRYVDKNSQFAYRDVYWQVPSSGGGGGESHSPTASITTGWTGSISGRDSLGSYTASSLARTYLLIDAKCGGETKKYYITLN